MAIIYENKQQIVNDVRDVVGVVENQRTMNNNRSNHQEDKLKVLGEVIVGMKEELQQGRINNQKLQESQAKMEQKLGEERKVANEAFRRNAISVQAQEDRWQGWLRKEQTNVYQNSNTEPKSEVKRENVPPGLTYGVVDQRYLERGERGATQCSKPVGEDTDSIMTERDTARNQKKGRTTQ